ncbi:MAG: alpha-mannosidase [Promethearchaeota archaeon]
MKATNIVIVPETHWDREWYLTFQEFRAKLVIMIDKLLEILRTDPDYKNFVLDGQVIPIEDYLEVRPEKEEEIKRYVKERRLSIGPMYVLPDEFLISGESFIRNFIFGHQLARKFGRVMQTAYIPDPFGHIAQLPQIVNGFDLSSIIFERGFGNEFEENKLDMEFIWESPGKAASVLAIHLVRGYGSLVDLDTSLKDGKYIEALNKIKRVSIDIEKYTATPIILLNNGSDHREACPVISEIVKQWNEMNPDILLEQNDFEYYIDKVLSIKPKLKSFQGELRGSKYSPVLSGVLSARMWIKQRNTEIEYLYEKYTEPFSTITWILDKYQKFIYPYDYIRTGLKWLIKNHPHDSICGCSIDQVHNEMVTRFDWADQIGTEVFSLSISYLSNLIDIKPQMNNRIALIVFNPLPWRRRDIVKFNGISMIKNESDKFPKSFKIVDSDDNEIEYQSFYLEENARFRRETDINHQFSFLADIPACGFKTYYVLLEEEITKNQTYEKEFVMDRNSIENIFYKVEAKRNGQINIYDKKRDSWYEDICQIEDVADWGDEYNYSGPTRKQIDKKYTTKDSEVVEILPFLNGPSQKMIKIKLILKLPVALTENRLEREKKLVENYIDLYISLYKNINRIDFKIDIENNSKDHRIRVLFPSKIQSVKVWCDGQFYIVPRNTILPNGKHWAEKPSRTNHQKDFLTLHDNSKCFAILNRGLPEYEAIKNEDGTITIALTLLRCIEWLSRQNLDCRRYDAGPRFKTPGAQCIGSHIFNFSLVIEEYEKDWFDSKVHIKGKEFNCPLKTIFPLMFKSALQRPNLLLLSRMGVLSDSIQLPEKNKDTYLPSELSFLEIDNKNIILSALKKSEIGENLIIRIYNISPSLEKSNLIFYKKLVIKKVEIVNFLEESPKIQIKAKINSFHKNNLEIILEPYVIATFKIEFDKIA